MLKIVWIQEFQTGIEEIDSEHRELFKIFNDLSFLIDRKVEPRIISTNLQYLFGFMKEHFRNEERLLKKIGYSDEELQSHCREHRSVLDQIADSVGWDGPESIYQKGTQTLEIFGEWLTQHIEETHKFYAVATK